ncbi:MAG: hypothetical protein WBG90_00130 [Saonia sp.]
MILTTNINIASEDIRSTIVGSGRSFPKTVVGPSNNNNSETAVYKLTEYTYRFGGNTVTTPSPSELTEFDNDKDNISWVVWVDGGLMDDSNDYIEISNRTTQTESETDFTLTSDKSGFIEELADRGYLEALVETTVENGNKINQLTIKFSKWLDDKNVFVEAFRNRPDHDIAKAYVETTEIKAAPEILNVYWINQQQNFISSSGFNTDISLVIISLGLTGSQINLTLHDDDTSEGSADDLILWSNNDGTYENSKDVSVTSRTTIIDYQVESSSSPAFANAFEPATEGSDLEVYLKISGVLIPVDQLNNQYAQLKLTSLAVINRLFFASKSSFIDLNGFTVANYTKLDVLYPGMTAYLVGEATNLNGSQVSFSVREETPVLVGANAKLPLLEGAVQQTDFNAEIVNDYAETPIKFQEFDSTTYNNWLDILIPENGNLEESVLNIKVTVNGTDYNSTEEFKLLAPLVIQHIYHDGFISQETFIQEITRKIRFMYHGQTEDYDFGIFDIEWAQKWIRGSKYESAGWKKITVANKTRYYENDGTPGLNKTPLVNILDTPIPSNTRKMFEFFDNGTRVIRLSEDTSREYFNPEKLAALLGAIIDSGYEDIITNGSVGTDGTGAPSVTHVNGNNIDFKYLRTDSQRARIDIVGGVIEIDDPLLDKIRQNEFLDSLEIFGFHSTKKSLSWFFDDSDSNGDGNIDDQTSNNLLNHCTVTKDANGKPKKSHHDHLHVQGFKANYKSS